MKNLKRFTVIITMLIFVLSGYNSFSSNSIQKETNQIQSDSLKNNTVCYEVFGMDCPGCQSSLEKQLKKIDGVAEAKASWEGKQVKITLKPGFTVGEKEIFKRIKKANFTPGEKIDPKSDDQ